MHEPLWFVQFYYGVLNNRGDWNNSVGWKKTVKLIIALVGNVPNNSIGWISAIVIMNQLKFFKRIEKMIKISSLLIIASYIFKKILM